MIDSVIEANNVKVVWRALLYNGLDTTNIIVKLYLPQLRPTVQLTPHTPPHIIPHTDTASADLNI